jgi:hypothetical protein
METIFDEEVHGRKALEEPLDSSKPRHTRAPGSGRLCWIIRLRQRGKCRVGLCRRLKSDSVIADAHPDTHAYADTCSHTDTHTYSAATADSNPDTYADTNSHTYAYANACTYPNASPANSSTQER